VESPFCKEEEEDDSVPGLEVVPASGCENEPSTLEYVSPPVSQEGPLPVSVCIPVAHIFHCCPMPYPSLDCIPPAYKVRLSLCSQHSRGSSSLSELAGSGDSTSDGVTRALGRGSSGGSCISLRSGREIPLSCHVFRGRCKSLSTFQSFQNSPGRSPKIFALSGLQKP